MSPATAPGHTTGPSSGGTLVAERLERRWSAPDLARSGLAVWAIVVLVLIGLTIRDGSGFWANANIANVLTGMVVLGLVALGQHLVVLTGGIDLSVGSLASLSALLTAVLIDGYPIRVFPMILAVLLGGALVGMLHAVFVVQFNVPAFVTTLATFYLLQGVAFIVSTVPAGQVTSALVSFGLNSSGPVPWVFSVFVLAVLAVWFLLQRTRTGRHVMAVGGEEEAAKSSGISPLRTRAVAYGVGSSLAALAGVLLAARASIGSPSAGAGLELSAITVVVIGGTSLMGGRGRLLGTVGGVLLLSLIESSFVLLQLPATLTDLIRGVVILAAAAVFVTRRNR